MSRKTYSPEVPQIRLLSLATLQQSPINPRQHSKKQVRQIARSIEVFGFNVPILVDGNLNIIAGHGRAQAASLLGMQTVPTIGLHHLTDAQIRAYRIADNRLTENSTWNDQLLAEQLLELSKLDLDFSIDVTGFEIGEIDLRIEALGTNTSEDSDIADRPPATGPAVSKIGDLWLLGNHRLLCGNSLDPAAYHRLMDGKKAAMVFTDPPYNVKIDGNTTGFGATRYREFAMASGEMDAREFAEFLARVFACLRQNSGDGSIHFVCMDWRHCIEILTAAQDKSYEFKNLCVWTKHNAGLGSFYRSQHELIFVFKSGRGSHKNNIELGRYGRHRSNVWSYPGVTGFGRRGEEGNLLALHPTVKPVSLIADSILDCSARGDIVLDAFMGSGTTIIAAERTGRHSYGIELDPLYVDIAVRRWQAFTGQTALHAELLKTFNEIDAEHFNVH